MSIPINLSEALQAQNATFIGGGTDIMPLLKNHVRDDKNFVFVGKLPELQGIEEADGFLRVGAGTTLFDVSENQLIRSRYPALAQAAAATASPQIRNIATIGGNILQDRRCIYFNQSSFWRSALPLCFKTGGCVCHQIPNSPVCRAIYYSDVATALLAYDAEVEYYEDGALRRAKVEELIRRHSLANGLACAQHLPVLVVRFLVPVRPDGEKSGFYKYAMRMTIDFPLINFALRVSAEGAKLVAGAVGTEPVTLDETAAGIAAGKSEEEIIAACEAELKRKAKPIKEAIITPVMKRELYRQIVFLLPLCR
ncbi:MAG: FAD binding domain-containing protein [Oscillospiraceae bacterium]|nr:FAD binding domain-containing protein [Oscillospiraceae bacterium]